MKLDQKEKELKKQKTFLKETKRELVKAQKNKEYEQRDNLMAIYELMIKETEIKIGKLSSNRVDSEY
jgi:hypothetical protein